MSDDIREEDLVGGSGGSAKYVVVGLLFFGAAVAAYFLTRPPAQPAATTAPTTQAPAAAPTPPPAYDDGLAIAEEEPDAGVDAGQTARRPTTGGGGGGDWSCSGEIASAQAATAFRSHSGEVRQCYERKLRTDPMLQGTLSVRLKIGTGGTVQGVQVGGSLRDPDVVSCVRERARAWRFPGPAGGCAVIAAPFTLTPRQ